MDFSESAIEALRFALPFAREARARVDLLHVVAPLTLPAETTLLPAEWSNYETERFADAKARLQKLAAAEISRAARGDILVRVGRPTSVIVATAREQQSDWVVLATLGHGGMKRFLLGSTAEGVVRAAPGPVLTVRSRVLARAGTPQSPPAQRINRILVPVDFTPASRRLLQFAVTFARQFRASLQLLHVVDHMSVPTRLGYMASRMQLIVTESGTRQLADWAARFVPQNLQAGQIVRFGAPYEVINRTAGREQADLILIATHGRRGLKHLLLGSTAERVVRHAPCPVLVVR